MVCPSWITPMTAPTAKTGTQQTRMSTSRLLVLPKRYRMGNSTAMNRSTSAKLATRVGHSPLNREARPPP